MARRLARIALVAALVVGVVAMHSWGHHGHGGKLKTESVITMSTHHHAGTSHHEPADVDPAGDEDPSNLLSLLGFMVCGGVLLRASSEILRPLLSRVLVALTVLSLGIETQSDRRRWRPPPLRLTPTSLLLDRIAVLRI